MSTETQEILLICEQLSEASRLDVRDYARSLLGQKADTTRQDAMKQWLASAVGRAKPGVTTDQIMSETRGEP